jgi:hypothetical protein
MKKLFCVAGWLALLPAARAHESWAPHTHAMGGQHSDLFVLCTVGSVMMIAGPLLFRWFNQRRRWKSSRVLRRRA